ncbi:MAG: Outer membrane protein assembly factor BamB precursor [Planctomycetes bacterium ADurb.Bin126]|nr:MAG: Outer membrane protein assembly factor BamB precursor [Planctomycetes bacterium ADurb.Bin126]HOD80537.1 PQQ-binding-like beta-propeller repeat protein [Phycisphaerae bacterium]HQL72378.1 PQQ-binding-like beta-propeller repeat protein [Phycisphaerae bacterium]
MRAAHSNLVLAAMLAGLCIGAGSCGRGPARPKSQTRPASAPAGRDWPFWRGDEALSGVAPGRLGRTFRLKWRYQAGSEVYSAPVAVGGRVYVGSYGGLLHCVDFETGKMIWTYKADGEVDAPPLVLDDRVYVGSGDSYLYALNAADGKLLWRYETGDKILGSANWIGEGKDRRLVVAGHDGRVHCVGLDGTRKWMYRSENVINGTPAVSDGQIVVGGCDSQLHVIDAANGSLLRLVEAGAYMAASTAVQDHRAYGGNYDGKVLCIDTRRGLVLWSYSYDDSVAPFTSSPSLIAGRVIIGGQDGRLHGIDAATGKGLWTFAAREMIESSPLVVGDKVVVGSDDGRLYVLSLLPAWSRWGLWRDQASLLWSYDTGQPIKSSPGIYRGTILIGNSEGHLYAFEEATR